MTGDLVFTQSAADSINGDLTSALNGLAGVVPASPATADLGHPAVTSAVGELFMRLGLYGAGLILGTQQCQKLVTDAGDKIGAFDRNLEAIAPVMAATGKTTPVSKEDMGFSSPVTVDIGSFSTSRSSYSGDDESSHSTTYSANGRTTVTDSHSEGGRSKSTETETDHLTGKTRTKTTYGDDSGTTVTEHYNNPTTGTSGSSVSHDDHHGNKSKLTVEHDAEGNRTATRQRETTTEGGR